MATKKKSIIKEVSVKSEKVKSVQVPKKKEIVKAKLVEKKVDKTKQVQKKVQKNKKKVEGLIPKAKFKASLKRIENERNARQERFCQLYASDKEFFGNGVETYLEVYDLDRSKPNWYKTACQSASRLLSNVKVYTRINELLDGNGLNDAFVDKQLLMLIQQHEDKGSKIAAIREYNKLKQRIIDKMELAGKDGKPLVIQTVNYSQAKTQ